MSGDRLSALGPASAASTPRSTSPLVLKPSVSSLGTQSVAGSDTPKLGSVAGKNINEPEGGEEASESGDSDYQESQQNVALPTGAPSDLEAGRHPHVRNIRVGITRDQCCGGSRKVLSNIGCLYTLNCCGANCCAWVFYLFVIFFLSLPPLALILFFRQRQVYFWGTVCLFFVPPAVYIHGLWYYRKPYLIDMLDEVLASGDMYARQAERTVRRHLFLSFVVTPCATVMICISFFSAQPLNLLVALRDASVYQALVVPFVIIGYFIVLSPMLFAAMFSITISLHGLKMGNFIEWMELERPSVTDVITAHHGVLRSLKNAVKHWRPAFTISSILNIIGLVVVFFTIATDRSFATELVPFGVMLLVLSALFQIYLLYSVARMHASNRLLNDAMLAYELRLPGASNDRVLLAVHSLTHRPKFTIFGFTGTYTIDALLCLMFVGIIGIIEYAI